MEPYLINSENTMPTVVVIDVPTILDADKLANYWWNQNEDNYVVWKLSDGTNRYPENTPFGIIWSPIDNS